MLFVKEKKIQYSNFLSFVILLSLTGMAQSSNSQQDISPKLYIISPADGSTQKNPVKIVFGLSGMGVAPAGIEMANTGHHHLLIDLNILPDKNLPIPSDEKHRHFGAGQTETSINFTPGIHTLQLMLGDHYHMQYEQAVISKKITINVE
tara:strand:+ start:84 stop:530 length:447 start_codon:yes stop_codon:yes gene_type:complete